MVSRHPPGSGPPRRRRPAGSTLGGRDTGSRGGRGGDRPTPRETVESLPIRARAPGSSSPGRTSRAPAATISSIISWPRSLRITVRVQSLNSPMPPVEMSACSAAKSGHDLHPSRVQACPSFNGTS